MLEVLRNSIKSIEGLSFSTDLFMGAGNAVVSAFSKHWTGTMKSLNEVNAGVVKSLTDMTQRTKDLVNVKTKYQRYENVIRLEQSMDIAYKLKKVNKPGKLKVMDVGVLESQCVDLFTLSDSIEYCIGEILVNNNTPYSGKFSDTKLFALLKYTDIMMDSFLQDPALFQEPNIEFFNQQFNMVKLNVSKTIKAKDLFEEDLVELGNKVLLKLESNFDPKTRNDKLKGDFLVRGTVSNLADLAKKYLSYENYFDLMYASDVNDMLNHIYDKVNAFVTFADKNVDMKFPKQNIINLQRLIQSVALHVSAYATTMYVYHGGVTSLTNIIMNLKSEV